MNKKQKEIFLKLIRENENILNIRGGRGYGVGHSYPVKGPKNVYGKSDIQIQLDNEEIDDNEEILNDNNEELNKKVKISRAFKNKKE